MRPSLLLLFLLGGVLLASCSSSKELPRKAMFPFEYQNENYQIISITSASGEGMNILLKVNEDSSEFRVLDQDQDGIIDVVQHGNVSLDQANRIYTIGISEAQHAGKVREREKERLFKYAEDQYYYRVQTFGLYSEMYYNRFMIRNIRLGIEESFLDVNADGILDKAEYSTRSHKEVQPDYLKVLKKGLDQDRIVISNEKYVVKISHKSPAS